jgi:hypothetical protein
MKAASGTIAAALAALALTGTPAAADQWARAVSEQLRLGNKVTRACSPNTGTCTTAIAAGDYMMIELEGATGGLAARYICQFNAHRDRRTCVDFDTKQRKTEVFAGGRWVDAK